jgi:hypothetical protein
VSFGGPFDNYPPGWPVWGPRACLAGCNCAACAWELYSRAYGRPIQQGCVCPAGAEKTCQGPMCPRKPLSPATAASQGPTDNERD